MIRNRNDEVTIPTFDLICLNAFDERQCSGSVAINIINELVHLYIYKTLGTY